jgi:hypothetical protein
MVMILEFCKWIILYDFSFRFNIPKMAFCLA